MEVNKNQAEANWQYPTFHKYQAEANTCPRMHATPSRTMEANTNHGCQYPMVHKYHADANTCLNTSP